MFTDEGVRVALEGMRQYTYTLGLWTGDRIEVRGSNYARKTVHGWGTPQRDGDMWRITADEVRFSVGMDGWGRVEGFFLVREDVVLDYIRFEPVDTRTDDIIRVVPGLTMKAL